jgi:hypothetical protein
MTARYIGRSPHGERGLKSLTGYKYLDIVVSLPTRGAWIEISLHAT